MQCPGLYPEHSRRTVEELTLAGLVEGLTDQRPLGLQQKLWISELSQRFCCSLTGV
jgi:hypothetical protein